jgi:hypothetical protein
MMNGCPKFVVSTTLEESLDWNNSRLIKENVAEEVSRLKQQPGKDILIFGSRLQVCPPRLEFSSVGYTPCQRCVKCVYGSL